MKAMNLKMVAWSLIMLLFVVTLYSCSRAEARYVDLETGEAVDLVEDEKTGLMVRSENRKPVRIYVDTKRKDTIWGLTGEVINGRLVQNKAGKWKYEGAGGEFKTERERDGDYKAKAGDEVKVKYDDGEYKIKRGDDYKKEVERDGDVTIKDGKKKIKIDGKTGKRTVKVDD